MSPPPTTLEPSDSRSDFVLPYRQRIAIMWEWSLRREALRISPQVLIIAPLLIFYFFWRSGLPTSMSSSHLNQGREWLRSLFGVATMMVIGGGAAHAAHAISWEISSELRELVRLTGIGPLALLCCKSLARWVTISCSLLVLVPLICFARTLGGVSLAQLASYGWGLLMLTLLTASMAALAGVVSTGSKNTGGTTAMAMFILMLLYHMLFWVTALLMLAATWLNWGSWSLPYSSGWDSAIEFLWDAAPVMVIYRISFAPDLFDPRSPSYWIHFLAAFWIFRYAAIVMINRFRSVVGTENPESTALAKGSLSIERPRCSAAPFFWKDAYVLVGPWAQRCWTIVYFLLANVIFFGGLMQWNSDFPLVIGIIAECISPILFAIRFDSLMSVEFRQKTWHDLMLLPIDRRVLLWAKARAILWEQRMAALPVGIAITFGLLHSPTAIFMTGIIASLAGVLMCQLAAINYVTPKTWWSGPTHMMGALFLIGLCAVVWIAFAVWPGFIMTAILLAVTATSIQSFIESSLNEWTETPDYQSPSSSP